MITRNDSKWDWVGTIETVSGNYANIVDIDPETVTMDDIATSLSNICRFNGHLPTFYSVAEHSLRVAWWLQDQGYDDDIILTGLLHDAAEAYVGDMMRPLKRLPEMEKVFKPIEDKVISIIHEKFGGTYPHPEVIHQADRATYEWEVENVRNGNHIGFSPDVAYTMYMNTYYFLTHPAHDDDLYDEEFDEGIRSDLLLEAADLVDGDRNAQYGDPIDDFRRTATYWSTHIGGVFRRKMHVLGYGLDEHIINLIDKLLDPHDVAIMMNQLKDSRLAWDPYKRDTWTDKAGYSACGYDCVIREA